MKIAVGFNFRVLKVKISIIDNNSIQFYEYDEHEMNMRECNKIE